MEITERNVTIRTLTPDDGKWLYNATERVISDSVYLGASADAGDWTEITGEEKASLEAEWEAEAEAEAAAGEMTGEG